MPVYVGRSGYRAVPRGHSVERGRVGPADDLVAQPDERLLNVGLPKGKNQRVAEALQNDKDVAEKSE